jgi:hypothetical protein
MDWTLAIHRNRTALLSIIAMLMKSIGLVKGAMLTTLPFYIHRKVLLILRPAEAAVRRLIVIAAYDLELRGVKPRKYQTASERHPAAFPNAYDFAPSFNLIDPLKTFGGERPDFVSFGPSFADDVGPQDTRRVPAAGLGRRLVALKNALDGIHKQALRLTRWYAMRDAALKQNRLHRLSPLRPGLPPGLPRRNRSEVQEILRECHLLAVYTRDQHDSS